jgi:hypothetical protein
MAFMGDGRDSMQNKMSVMANTPEERYRAALTIAQLSLSSPEAHEDCRNLLEAVGLFDPEVLTARPVTP